MLYLLTALGGIFLTIFFVVGIHELGHFLMARLVGVKVQRFSIGFGKTLFCRVDKTGTEYVLAAVPLGGYVKMLDESESDIPQEELPYAYNTQPIYKKIAIVAAGPLFNLIFAFIIYWALFVVGFVGMVPLVGKITPTSIAAKAGMRPQQEIIQVDNQPTLSWMAVVVNLLTHAGDKDQLKITTRTLNTHHTDSYTLNLARWHMDDLKPDPLSSLGIIPYEPEVPAVIGSVSSKQNKLFIGDKVLAFNKTPIKDWQSLAERITQHPDEVVTLKILRKNKTITLPIKISYKRNFLFKKTGYLGIAPHFEWPKKMLRLHQYGPIEALSKAWHETVIFCKLNLITFGKLITGKVSFSSLGGPITIFSSAGAALNNGILPFLSFLAFLSIAIGLINILPIPGLDGGHLLFHVIESIIRRPISQRVYVLFYRLGFIILLLLIVQALANDILRL
jgi:regulator of sigma E protease